jgi:myo-inositol-1-phosphate synthase
MVNPCEVVIGGWDINKMNLAEATQRAQVFDYDLQVQLAPYLKDLVPLPSIYYPDFIASNQCDRADNLLPGNNKLDHLNAIRKNIRDFKQENNLDKVLVLWTANTERFCVEQPEIHGTTERLMKAVAENHPEVSASTIFALATILEGSSYINGSPQNTLVPGVIELAAKQGVFVVGDDFKTGQTKIKTTIADFLIGAGIKSRSIVSYNHLGNNDGKNLSQEEQFKSKEFSKRGCIDDILESNRILYPTEEDLKIDHQIVIKYVPFTGDSKKAMDEYLSSIFMGGQHTFVLYNVCEDSLLAAPIIIDLFLLTELFERIQYRVVAGPEHTNEFQHFDTILSWLGYLMKSPKTEEGINVVNALPRQRSMIENILKVCAGLTVDDNLRLDVRLLRHQRQ